MKKQDINNSRLKVNQLTSLTEQEYVTILEVFDRKFCYKWRKYTLQGHIRKHQQARESKNSSLLGSEKKVDLPADILKGTNESIYTWTLL